MLFDTNHDGHVDWHDLPTGVKPGTKAAKAWWGKVDAHAKAKKSFSGMPLRPGPHKGDGDFDYMVNKLIVTKGLSYQSAVKVAGRVRQNLYGGK